MKTKHCEECQHGQFDSNTWQLTCDKGHKPRFYAPRSPVDTNYGHKRKCADFVAIVALSVLTGCTSLESMIESCHAKDGHAVIVVNPELTEIQGVRCEVNY